MNDRQPVQQPANAHHLRVGDYMVTTLQDAYMQGSLELVGNNVDAAETERLHAASRRPSPPRITLNVYLVDTGDQRILVDTGLGGLAEDTGARLETGLARIGLTRGDIDTILITHGHPDHIGGLITANGERAFPGLEVLIPGAELDYWDREPPAGVSDVQRRQFAADKRVFDVCRDQMRRLDDTAPVPGVTRVPLPGHTPEHSGYRVQSQGESLLIWADIVHLPQIQFPRPDAALVFDTDPAQAARTRTELFAELARSGELIAGHHIDFPGVGYVATDGDGYRFLPHVWSPVA